MKNEIVVISLGALLFALCTFAEAQQPGKIPRLGYVRVVGMSGMSSAPGPNVEAFRQGLKDLGFVEGKTS
jgi:putative tryptophan/tyrosine transport system substrate-binding protein